MGRKLNPVRDRKGKIKNEREKQIQNMVNRKHKADSRNTYKYIINHNNVFIKFTY